MFDPAAEHCLAVVRRQLARAKAAAEASDKSRTKFYEWLAVEWLALAVWGSRGSIESREPAGRKVSIPSSVRGITAGPTHTNSIGSPS